MKKNKGRTIGVATCLLVLLTSGVLTSAITQQAVATVIQQNGDTEDVVVQILGDSYTQEAVVTLTKQKASDLETVIETVTKKLQTVTSREEIREIYAEALSSFQSLGLFTENADRNEIFRIFERDRPLRSSKERMQAHSGRINWNALCLIAGDTTHTEFLGIRTWNLLRIAVSLQLHGFPGSCIFSLAEISWFLDLVKPFSVMQRIQLGRFGIPGGVMPADGWIVTCGLTGLRKWSGSMEGNLEGFYTRETGVMGFTGIKIMHDRLSRTFYLGTALLVSISQ